MTKKRTRRNTCQIPDCHNTAGVGQQHCTVHRYGAALQAELERQAALLPSGIRKLTNNYSALADLLAGLTKILNYADPTPGRVIDSAVPSARLKDAWAGDSQLDEVSDNAITLRGAGSSHHARQLKEQWGARIEQLATRLAQDLDPNLKPARVPKPRCRRRNCSGYGKRQDVDSICCKYCGEQLVQNGESLAAAK